MRAKVVRSSAVLALVAMTGAGTACGSNEERAPSGSGVVRTDDSRPEGSGKAAATDANPVDRAFVAQMVPHHEMAVEMARMAQQLSRRAEVQDTADAIVSAQEREIEDLRDIAGRVGVTPAALPMAGHHHDHGAMLEDARTLGLSMEEMGMSMDMHGLLVARPFDRAFIDAMIPHHQGAIRMARVQLAEGSNARLKAISEAIVRAQKKEIREMNAWRADWYGKPSPAGGVPQA